MMNFQVGIVIRTDTTKNSVAIKSFRDGSVIENITMDNTLDDQHLPVIGSNCLFYRESNYITKIIKTWTNSSGSENVDPGDRVFQSEGGGKIRLDQGGSTSSSSSDNRSFIKNVNNQGVDIISDEIILEVVSHSKIHLDVDGTVTISKFDVTDNTKLLAVYTITPEGEMYLDGQKVFLGLQASDTTVNQTFGGVVTTETHPFDYITGIPILGSTTVRARGVE